MGRRAVGCGPKKRGAEPLGHAPHSSVVDDPYPPAKEKFQEEKFQEGFSEMAVKKAPGTEVRRLPALRQTRRNERTSADHAIDRNAGRVRAVHQAVPAPPCADAVNGNCLFTRGLGNASFVATTGLQISHKALVTLRRLFPASLCSFFVQIIPFFKAGRRKWCSMQTKMVHRPFGPISARKTMSNCRSPWGTPAAGWFIRRLAAKGQRRASAAKKTRARASIATAFRQIDSKSSRSISVQRRGSG
jgi:hypothetical protein